MLTEELLEQCLHALTSGENIPPDLARYLSRHPEQMSEVEKLLAIAQRISRLSSATLSPSAHSIIQARLAAHLGSEPSVLEVSAAKELAGPQAETTHSRKKPLSSIGRISLARLCYEPKSYGSDDIFDDISEARIRAASRDLTPEDIGGYIGVGGEDYLYDSKFWVLNFE